MCSTLHLIEKDGCEADDVEEGLIFEESGRYTFFSFRLCVVFVACPVSMSALCSSDSPLSPRSIFVLGGHPPNLLNAFSSFSLALIVFLESVLGFRVSLHVVI